MSEPHLTTDPDLTRTCEQPANRVTDVAEPAVGATRPTLSPSPDTPMWPAAALPSIPDYEMLHELGRGGMGVVYKARQVKLGRLVALKMILAGSQADADSLSRFRTEAAAVARSPHPHIVQIYEVGEHGGLPFFALEFCPGGSLDRKLAGTPLPERDAAVLLEKLARAMDAVHQKGVIHRDLKLANVLLGEDGTPKITDFGLAKHLDRASQTQTGEVMGTPSYMAPEQAEGRTKEIGPPADIYALGAILYECLTGRPPFRAATPWDTILQVVGQEPVPPSRLNPKVSRDLETICLKCLEKAPAKRYASATALAEDLRRFLAGEPIQARRAGIAERAVKWARRRPTAAVLVLVSGLAMLGLAAVGLGYNASLRTERDRAQANLALALQAVEVLTDTAEKHADFEPLLVTEERRADLLLVLREFLNAERRDAAVPRETGLTCQRVGDILRLLGEYADAETAYRQAIQLWRRLIGAGPGPPEFRENLATSQNYLGEVLRLSARSLEAQEAYDQARQELEKLAADFPDQAEHWEELARTHYNLGILLTDRAALADAKRAFDQAITCLQQVTGPARDRPAHQFHLARTYLNRADLLWRLEGLAEAQKSNEAAVALLRKLSHRYSYLPRYQRALGMSYNNAGNLLVAAGKPAAAVAELREALSLFEKLADNFQKVPFYREQLANACNSLGQVLAAEKQWPEAQQTLEKAQGHFAELVQQHPNVPPHRGSLGITQGNLGLLRCERSGPDAEAVRLFRAAVGNLQAALEANPRNPTYRKALHAQYRSLAESLVQLKDPAGAVAAATALAEVFPDQAVDSYHAACFLARCVPLVGDDPKRTADYAEQVRVLLRQALTRGLKLADRLPQPLEADIFRPLRERGDFRSVWDELEVQSGRDSGKPRP